MTQDISNPFDVNLGTGNIMITDTVSPLEGSDFYTFTAGASGSSDLYLDDLSAHGQVLNQGEMVAYSNRSGTTSQSIHQVLEEGNYYIQAVPYQDVSIDDRLSIGAEPLNPGTDPLTQGNLSYQLTLDGTSDGNLQSMSHNDYDPLTGYGLIDTQDSLETITSEPSNGNTTALPTAVIPQFTDNTLRYIEEGGFGADTFTYQEGYKFNIFSGNGNYEYSSGQMDTLDLSDYASNTVGINLARNNSNSGVVYNLGDGARVFDAITFANGSQILFENIEQVKFADTTLNLSNIPNDPLFNEQWNLHMTGVHNAWRFTQGNDNVLLGIGDTGLGNADGSIHPDLRDTIFDENNYLDESRIYLEDGTILPDTSHGTAVQGIMGAATNNSEGIAGINWNSPVYSLDVLPGTDQGDDIGDYDLAEAAEIIINRANTQGQRAVINLSLSYPDSEQFEEIIAENQDNALFVIASGNDSQNEISYPANLADKYDNVIAVGASSRGENAPRIDYSNFGDGLTLMAPSEFNTTLSVPNENIHDYYTDVNRGFTGTSAAAPIVSGIASLLWSMNETLTADQIKSILSQTATDAGSAGDDIQHAHGLVNADAAVRRVMAISRGFFSSPNS